MKCVGCDEEYETNEYYFYNENELGFCPECKRRRIEVRGKMVVKKEDLELIKQLLK
jgi:hypothetical protein